MKKTIAIIEACGLPDQGDWRENVKRQQEAQEQVKKQQVQRHTDADEILKEVLEPETEEA